jgi:hypothetical protein
MRLGLLLTPIHNEIVLVLLERMEVDGEWGAEE